MASSNCLDILLLGDRHHVQGLRHAALERVGELGRKMFKIKDWYSKIRDHPDLMKDIIIAVAPY
jgi:hypothetical protein